MKNIEQINYSNLAQKELSNLKKSIEWNGDKDWERYQKLTSKDTVTDQEMARIVNYTNKMKLRSPDFCMKRITDNQAKELWKLECRWLRMWKLENITDVQAEELWYFERLDLDWLKTITDRQATLLSNVEELYLNWLTTITDRQANKLSHVKTLHIVWLRSMTDRQATELAKVKHLNINKDILTPKQKEILKNNIM